MRSLIQNTIVAKFEGHSQQVKHLSFSKGSYDFVSAAGNECLLWERPDLQKGMQEVMQPAKILDIESSNHV
jgi:hypothetical protein